MSASRLVHVGSAVVDYVYRIHALPTPGADITASSFARIVGGGFNVMVACRRSGMDVAFGGQHGTGVNGDFLRTALASENIATLTPRAAALDTGNCVVMVTGDAERSFVSWPGAEGFLTAATMAPVSLLPGDWVFTSGYTLTYPGSRDALTDWIEALPPEIPFVLDPTPVVADIPAAILSRVLARTTWLSCNVAEASVIAGPGEVDALFRRLLADHCPNAAGIVIRAGEQGCFVGLADGTARGVGGFKVSALDTNGAGDTHIGAFVSALARGAEPFEAARYANAAAAISVTRHGGSSAPTDSEIQTFLASGTARPGRQDRNEKANA